MISEGKIGASFSTTTLCAAPCCVLNLPCILSEVIAVFRLTAVSCSPILPSSSIKKRVLLLISSEKAKGI